MPGIMATGFIGAAVAWWSFAATARQVLDPVEPSAGLLGVVSMRAQAAEANALITPGASKGQRDRARQLALAVLRREPGNVVAVRALALAAASQNKNAEFSAWLHYGESLSRRDSITQFALIENGVAAGNTHEILRHYNRAMLTNVSSRDVLLPILIPAVSDIAVAKALVPFLQRRPAWWPHFVGALNGGGTNPAAIRLILQALRLDPGNESEAAALGAGLTKMVALGDQDGAYALYRDIRKPGRGLIRDGGFEQSDAFGPFEWAIHDDQGSSASRQERTDGRGLALFVTAGDSDGVVAEQSAILAPGKYALAAQMVPDSASAPAMTVRVQCASTGTELGGVTSTMPQTTGNIRTVQFSVGPGCRLVRMIVGVGAASTGQAAGWVDDIAITAL